MLLMIGSSNGLSMIDGCVGLMKSFAVDLADQAIMQSLGRLFSVPILRLTAFVAIFTTGILLGTHYPTWISVYARRPSRYISHLPASLHHTQAFPDPVFPLLPQPRDEIPNIVHYVYGLDLTATDDFPYYAYLGMRSAMVSLRPEKIMFHCLKEPSGFWWEQVKLWKQSDTGEDMEMEEKLVEVVWARNPQWIGKDKKEITKVSARIASEEYFLQLILR